MLQPEQTSAVESTPAADDQIYPSSEDAKETPTFDTQGLRVLAVDDNAVCLKILVALLHQCRYNVTETTNPVEALQILRMRKNEFDLVITGMRMLEMDGLDLIQKISLEMNLPVVILSADDNKRTIMKAIRYGARDYIIKPPRMDQIKNVWQHVVRKRLFGPISKDVLKENSSVSSGETRCPVEDFKRKFAEMEDKGKTDEEAASTLNDNADSVSAAAAKKKKRVNWTADLHNKFIDAMEKIGPNAVPKEILKVMNVSWLTRANVASHLQKYKNTQRDQAQSTPPATNSYMNNVVSAAGEHGYQSSHSLIPTLPQGLPYHQNSNLQHILSPGLRYANQHQISLISHDQRHNLQMNRSANQAPTILNGTPVTPRNVLNNMQGYSLGPRCDQLRFSPFGTDRNNMANYYSFRQPFANPSELDEHILAAAAPSAFVADAKQNCLLANGQNYLGLTSENQDMQLDWTTALEFEDNLLTNSNTKTSNVDAYHVQTTPIESPGHFFADPAHTDPFETPALGSNSDLEFK
ncbi:hypothetical protein QQ045_032735 [Rhodiola kirilowii]